MKQFRFAAGIATLMLSAVACNQPSGLQESPKGEVTTRAARIKRGEYLVTIMGCHDCHTPKKMTDHGPVPDMDRALSGYNAGDPLGSFDTATAQSGRWVMFNNQLTAFAGPWGVSFAANLTPDPTGLGNWDLDHFKKALKEGKFKGIDNSRPLLPPMPWQNFTRISDEDASAIFDYLQSVRPVANRVPAAIAPSGKLAMK